MPGAVERGGAALSAEGEPSAVDKSSTLPVARRHTVADEHPRRGPRRRAQPTRSCQRRATADEAKSLR